MPSSITIFDPSAVTEKLVNSAVTIVSCVAAKCPVARSIGDTHDRLTGRVALAPEPDGVDAADAAARAGVDDAVRDLPRSDR